MTRYQLKQQIRHRSTALEHLQPDVLDTKRRVNSWLREHRPWLMLGGAFGVGLLARAGGSREVKPSKRATAVVTRLMWLYSMFYSAERQDGSASAASE